MADRPRRDARGDGGDRVYSMPVYHALLAHGEFEVLMCNDGHVKNVPGRKTDLLTELSASSPRGCVRRRAAAG